MNNDEIIEKVHANVNGAWITPDIEEQLNYAINEASANTAKQIFEELDKFIFEHDNGNSKNLEDFILQSLEYSDKDEEEIATEDYLTLKNKYK